MESVALLAGIYFILYLIFIGRLVYGFTQIKTTENHAILPKTTFSIVVPFRNEAENLPQLLESIKNLDYPAELFEIILIDDFSEDKSQSLVYQWRMENGKFHTTLIENVRISNSPKKDAINRAVPIVVNEWVITTDADCTVPKNWLLTLNDYIQSHDVSMIAGAVVYQTKASFVQHFQQMDLMSLQGATIGSFGLNKAFMCNGANFAYKKQFFLDLGGFGGIDKMASGDDVFLLQKAVANQRKKVHYLKSREAIVTTKPLNSWRVVFFQRVRWASKAVSYENDFGQLLSLVVFLGNLSLLALGGLAVIRWISWEIFVGIFAIKFIADAILLLQTNGFLRKGQFFFPLFSSVFYPFFSVAVALYSLYGKYEWKGRKLR